MLWDTNATIPATKEAPAAILVLSLPDEERRMHLFVGILWCPAERPRSELTTPSFVRVFQHSSLQGNSLCFLVNAGGHLLLRRRTRVRKTERGDVPQVLKHTFSPTMVIDERRKNHNPNEKAFH